MPSKDTEILVQMGELVDSVLSPNFKGEAACFIWDEEAQTFAVGFIAHVTRMGLLGPRDETQMKGPGSIKPEIPLEVVLDDASKSFGNVTLVGDRHFRETLEKSGLSLDYDLSKQVVDVSLTDGSTLTFHFAENGA